MKERDIWFIDIPSTSSTAIKILLGKELLVGLLAKVILGIKIKLQKLKEATCYQIIPQFSLLRGTLVKNSGRG